MQCECGGHYEPFCNRCEAQRWIKFTDKEPPCGEDVIVIKQYLDAPYGPSGYDDGKSFWTSPMITVDSYWSDKKWHLSGRVSHWMHVPKLPEDL